MSGCVSVLIFVYSLSSGTATYLSCGLVHNKPNIYTFRLHIGMLAVISFILHMKAKNKAN